MNFKKEIFKYCDVAAIHGTAIILLEKVAVKGLRSHDTLVIDTEARIISSIMKRPRVAKPNTKVIRWQN